MMTKAIIYFLGPLLGAGVIVGGVGYYHGNFGFATSSVNGSGVQVEENKPEKNERISNCTGLKARAAIACYRMEKSVLLARPSAGVASTDQLIQKAQNELLLEVANGPTGKYSSYTVANKTSGGRSVAEFRYDGQGVVQVYKEPGSLRVHYSSGFDQFDKRIDSEFLEWYINSVFNAQSHWAGDETSVIGQSIHSLWAGYVNDDKEAIRNIVALFDEYKEHCATY